MMDRDEILRKLGGCRLGIFGSYARGEPKEASDMDFLVKFEQATFHSYFAIRHGTDDEPRKLSGMMSRYNWGRSSILLFEEDAGGLVIGITRD